MRYVYIFLALLICGCKNTYFKGVDNKIYTEKEFEVYRKSVFDFYKDSLGSEKASALEINFSLKPVENVDSTIFLFDYSVLVGRSIIKNSSDAKIYTFLDKSLPMDGLLLTDQTKFDASKLIGKPTLINFWFPNCPPCVEEIPALNDLKRKFGSDVNFISITFESQSVVEAFKENNTFDYMSIIDADVFVEEIGLNSYPQNIFLDKSGIVKYIKGSMIFDENMIPSTKEFEDILLELLNE